MSQNWSCLRCIFEYVNDEVGCFAIVAKDSDIDGRFGQCNQTQNEQGYLLLDRIKELPEKDILEETGCSIPCSGVKYTVGPPISTIINN